MTFSTKTIYFESLAEEVGDVMTSNKTRWLKHRLREGSEFFFAICCSNLLIITLIHYALNLALAFGLDLSDLFAPCFNTYISCRDNKFYLKLDEIYCFCF